jgi:hypothetical protein
MSLHERQVTFLLQSQPKTHKEHQQAANADRQEHAEDNPEEQPCEGKVPTDSLDQVQGEQVGR